MSVQDMIEIINYIRGLEEGIYYDIRKELNFIVREISSINDQLSEFFPSESINLGVKDDPDLPF